MGTIAYIAHDGCSVQMRTLRANPVDGIWGLSEPTTVPEIHASLFNPIVQLAWSDTDRPHLAVMDYHGCVDIFSFGQSLNSPVLRHDRRLDTMAHYGGVVACHWLQPAPLEGGNPRFESCGPFHPLPGRSAFVYMTEAGVLKMLWMHRDYSFRLVTHRPDGINKLTAVEHASFCGHDSKFHRTLTRFRGLNVADVLWGAIVCERRLYALEAHIQWGRSSPDGNQTLGELELAPTIKARVRLDIAFGCRTNSTLSRIQWIPALISEATGATLGPMQLFLVYWLDFHRRGVEIQWLELKAEDAVSPHTRFN